MRDQLDIIIEWEGCKYSDIICEYLSTKSKFTKNENYVTLKNDFILWAMWMKVWVIWQKYHNLNLRKKLSSLVNLIKFNYLELIKSKIKN